jgi:Flp pilus assembly protein TadB
MDIVNVVRIFLGVAVFATVYFLFTWLSERRRLRSLNYIDARNLQISEEMARERHRKQGSLARLLQRIGYTGDPAPFFVGVAFLYLLVASLTILLGASSGVALLIALPTAASVTIGVLGWLERRRQARATSQMMQVLRNVITYLEAGNTPQQAFYKTAALVGNPLRDDILSALATQVGTIGLGKALEPLKTRYNSPATRLLVSALEINDLVGAKLVPTLRQAEEMLRSQLELSAEATAEISQAKAEFIGITAVISFISVSFLAGAGEEAWEAYTSPIGVIILFAALANYAFGIWRTFRTFRRAKGGVL